MILIIIKIINVHQKLQSHIIEYFFKKATTLFVLESALFIMKF